MSIKKFDNSKFEDFIIKNQVIGFFPRPVKLKSGQLSKWYVNWRTPCSDVYLLDQIADFLISFIQDHKLEPDCILGVPEGATKLGVITQFKWAQQQVDYKNKSYILPMGRKEPKSHGAPEDKFFVGAPVGRVILLEDVTTTGGSLVEMLKMLLDQGVNVVAAICLTNRDTSDNDAVKNLIENNGVKFYSLSDADKLLVKINKK